MADAQMRVGCWHRVLLLCWSVLFAGLLPLSVEAGTTCILGTQNGLDGPWPESSCDAETQSRFLATAEAAYSACGAGAAMGTQVAGGSFSYAPANGSFLSNGTGTWYGAQLPNGSYCGSGSKYWFTANWQCNEGYLEYPGGDGGLGTCVTSCPEGTEEVDGLCETPVDPGETCEDLAGRGVKWFDGSEVMLPPGTAPSSSQGCVGGCVAQASSASFAQKGEIFGTLYRGKYNGESCTAPSDPDPPSPVPVLPDDEEQPEVCNPGYTFKDTGGGVWGCSPVVAGDSPSNEQTTTRKTNPDGTTTEKTTTYTYNGTTTIIRERTVTKDAEGNTVDTDEKITEVTGTKGPATSSGEGEGSGDGFCDENPTAPICGSSSFGGNCGGTFTCDGDAVQCAIAKEQHKRNCELFVNETEESSAYESAKAEDAIGDMKNDADEIDITDSLDADGFLGGGSCLEDLSVSVMGQDIEIPFSMLCSYLALAGSIFLGVGYIIAAMIVFRG